MGSELSPSCVVISSQLAPLSCGLPGHQENWKWVYSSTASASCVVFNQEDWMNRNIKKEDRKASWCSRFTEVRSHQRPLVPLPTSDVFWIIVIGEDVDSDAECFYPRFDLHRYVNADKGPGQECLIGILQAWLISKLVLLQCLSWTGIFIREDINLPFQMELKKLLSMFISHLCFLHRALSACWSSPLFLIAHPSPSKAAVAIMSCLMTNGMITMSVLERTVFFWTFNLTGLRSLQAWFVSAPLPCPSFKAWSMSWM